MQHCLDKRFKLGAIDLYKENIVVTTLVDRVRSFSDESNTPRHSVQTWWKNSIPYSLVESHNMGGNCNISPGLGSTVVEQWLTLGCAPIDFNFASTFAQFVDAC